MRTRARRDGDHWVLDGAKCWITNAGEADLTMWSVAEIKVEVGVLVELFVIAEAVVLVVTHDHLAAQGVNALLVEATQVVRVGLVTGGLHWSVMAFQERALTPVVSCWVLANWVVAVIVAASGVGR